MKTKTMFFLIIGIILLAGSLVLCGFLYFQLQNLKAEKQVTIDNSIDDAIGEETEQMEPIVDTTATTSEDFQMPQISTISLDVNWLGNAKSLSDTETNELLNKLYPEYSRIQKEYPSFLKKCQETQGENCPLRSRTNIKLYLVGNTKETNFPVYIIEVPFLCQEGPMPDFYKELTYYNTTNNSLVRLITTDESTYFVPYPKYVEINKENCSFSTESTFQSIPLFKETVRVIFSELAPPQKISIPTQKDGTRLRLVEAKYAGFYSSWQNIGPYGDFGLSVPGNNEDFDKVVKEFENAKVVFTDSKVGDVYFNGECYFIRNQVGSIFAYNIEPSFLRKTTPDEAEKAVYSPSFVIDAKWLLGDNKENYYSQGEHFSGCGAIVARCTDIVTDLTDLIAENLVPAAETASGNILYELKDKFNNLRYWKLFQSKGYLLEDVNIYDIEKPNKAKLEKLGILDEYNAFLGDYPLLFWKDYTGQWRFLQSTKYMQMAECGKPVIYLYPQKDTDVKVEVKPNGGFTKTEPMYDNGWFVRATPQSELFNYTDKTNYPYLFWEGKAYNFITPNYGFVMSKDEVGVKMPKILAKLGLNEKETNDFLDFWQTKLEVKPYVFVTFLPQREFDKLAPLTVNPKPDTVIRVFMDYAPLDAPVKVAPMQIRTPERVGFTVVEWGGRLH